MNIEFLQNVGSPSSEMRRPSIAAANWRKFRPTFLHLSNIPDHDFVL